VVPLVEMPPLNAKLSTATQSYLERWIMMGYGTVRYSVPEESHPSPKKKRRPRFQKVFLKKIFHWQKDSEVRSTPYRTVPSWRGGRDLDSLLRRTLKVGTAPTPHH
jgi:hypothetical protein